MTSPMEDGLLAAARLALDACCHRIAAQDTEIARLKTERDTLCARIAALTAQLRRQERQEVQQ